MKNNLLLVDLTANDQGVLLINAIRVLYLQLALLFLFDQLCALNFQQRVFKPEVYQKPRCGEAKAANRQPLIDR